MTKIKLNHIDLGGDQCQLPVDTNLYILVQELPDRGKKDKIYLVKDDTAPEGNIYNEYSFINGAWESLGQHSSTIDVEVPTKVSQLENDEGFVKSASLGTAAYKNVEDLQGGSIDYVQGSKHTFSTGATIDIYNNGKAPKNFIVEIGGDNVADEYNIPSSFYIEVFDKNGRYFHSSLFDIHSRSRVYIKGELLFINPMFEDRNDLMYSTYKLSITIINKISNPVESKEECYITTLQPDELGTGISIMLNEEGICQGWYTINIGESGPNVAPD